MAKKAEKASEEKKKAEEVQQGLGRPTGSSTLWAEWRRGLKDLQDFVLNAFPDSQKSRDEPGAIAVPTQLEIYKSKHQAEPSQEFGKDSKSLHSTKEASKDPLDAACERAASRANEQSQEKDQGRDI